MTEICQLVTGNTVAISQVAETSDVDLRIVVGDSRNAQQDFDWRPLRNPRQIVTDICRWIDEERERVAPLFT